MSTPSSPVSTLDQTKPQHQTNWDWRAASNFMFGGAGSGLLLFAAMTAGPTTAYRPYGMVALGLIALGLFCVSLEIGRPLRSLNVFLHIQTSWMTREALVAGLLFLSGLAALWTQTILWIWIVALFGMSFLYCQARILTASKGIPAWREPRLAPLIIMTGLTEGAGLLAIIAGVLDAAMLARSIAAALLFGIVMRAVLWRGYRNELVRQSAPPQTLVAFQAIDFPFMTLGHWAAALALGFAFAAPEFGGVTWLCAAGGFLVVGSGWLFKYTLVARAAYNQGYALPRLPVRGRAPALKQ